MSSWSIAESGIGLLSGIIGMITLCTYCFIVYLYDLRRTKTTTLAQTKRTKPIILISTLLDSFVFGKNLGVLNVTV